MWALRFPADSTFFSICRMIPSNAFSIFLPAPCKSFSSIVLNSSHKAYLSVKYSPKLTSCSCNCFWTSLALLSFCFPSAKYLRISSYYSNNLIPWAYSWFGLPSTITETFYILGLWNLLVSRVSCVWLFFLKQNQDTFQGFTRGIKWPIPCRIRLIYWNLSMPENSVIQQNHFIIFSFDRSCEGRISNNLVFWGDIRDFILSIWGCYCGFGNSVVIVERDFQGWISDMH